ncbi:MAG: hypothetical protein K6E44_04990 [Bacteroidales bacterium]|nr:hypothetical protein [Bacteroidales bacterium]
MIPQRLVVLVPASIRDKWANRIVKVFQENNPLLYEEIEEWSLVPEESSEMVVSAILAAAEKVHVEFSYRDEA